MKEWILDNTTVTEEEYDRIINPNTVIMNNESKTYYIEKQNKHPITDINIFTLKKPTIMQRKKFKIIKKKDINRKNYYIYKDIEFYILAEFLKNMKHWLYSIERLHQCFLLNSYICRKLNIQSYLITALCESTYSKNYKKYLHTFILITSNDNQEYIIDGTANIIMKKDIFFNIYKPEIISKISKERLQQEIPLVNEFRKDNKIFRGEYLCFPDEVMHTIKKLRK